MDLTSLVLLLLTLAVVGFLCYLIITYIPMPEIFKQVIVVVIAIVVILYVLGLLTGHAGIVRLR